MGIRHIASGVITQVASDPVWVGGIWECGDHRFVDQNKTAYEWDGVPVPLSREVKQAARTKAVDAIVVTTTAGHTFDGDEISQNRMARAIIVLNAQPQTPVPTVNWVLAANTVIQATAAELTEALTRAGAAQAAVWVIA